MRKSTKHIRTVLWNASRLSSCHSSSYCTSRGSLKIHSSWKRTRPSWIFQSSESCVKYYSRPYTKNFKNCFFFFFKRNVDFGDILTEENRKNHENTKYNLIANVVHDGEPGKGTYRVHVLQRSTGQWYEMQDLHVTSILPPMITLTEAYIQIYERQSPSKK